MLPGLNLPAITEPTFEQLPRYTGASGQEQWIVRQLATGERTVDKHLLGLIPGWIKEAAPRVKPINATAERVATAPMFRDAYARRRCLLPIYSFFEWKAIKGANAKKPYCIGLKSDQLFALAAIWEVWRNPESDELVRSFCVITTVANDLVSTIHDRMAVIVPPMAYDRWLSKAEPDPRDLLVPFPAELMRMWPTL
jgi:putative SOS response-associated peptidase YedK